VVVVLVGAVTAWALVQRDRKPASAPQEDEATESMGVDLAA